MQDSAGIKNALGKSYLYVAFLIKGITINKKCALIMNCSDFLKQASSSGTGITSINQQEAL